MENSTISIKFNIKTQIAFIFLVFILVSMIISPYVAVAEENPVTLSFEDDKYILKWRAYSLDTTTFDGYAILINENWTNLNGVYTTSFNVTDMFTTVGDYNISVYAKCGQDHILIGTTSTTITATLDMVDSVIFSNGTLYWNAVEYADGYAVFVNNIFIGTTTTENFDVDRFLALSGDFDVIIYPFSENTYLLTPSPTVKTLSINNVLDVDLTINVFNYIDGIVLSWQPLENITYQYTLTSSTDTISGNTIDSSIVFDNLADGTYTFELYGDDSNFTYSFGTIQFSVVNGEVCYE